MRNWYKHRFMKLILVLSAIAASAIGAVSLVLVAGVSSTMSKEAVFGKGEAYEQSEFFEELMRSATNEMLYMFGVTEELEVDGNYDPNRLVDVMGYAKSGKITGENSSGLAYTLEELSKWGNQEDVYEYDKSILVCQKPNGTYRYYWMDDFKKMFEEGSISLEADKEEQKTFLEELEEGYLWQESRTLVLKDGEEEYTDIWTYDGSVLREPFAPDGAKDILEVVNNTPALNGKLTQVYDSILNAYESISNLYFMYENQPSMWTEGNTNFTYVFVNKANKKIYTNNSVFQDYENIEKNLNMLKDTPDIRYVVVRPKLKDFESNMDVMAAHWLAYIDNNLDVLGEDYLAVSAVDTTYPIQDIFYEASKNYYEYEPYMDDAVTALFVSVLLLVIAVVWLTVVAGRKADGNGELYLHPFDRWKTELSAALTAGPWLVLTALLIGNWSGVGIREYAYSNIDGRNSPAMYYYGLEMTGEDVCIIAVYAALTAALFLIGYLSLVRRIKGGTLWKDSILKMLLVWAVKCWRFLDQNARSFWSRRRVLWKTILVFAVIVFSHWLALAMAGIYGTPVFSIFLIIGSEAAAAYLLIRDAIAKERVKEGIHEIASGNLEYQLPLDVRQGGDYQDMAENLNNIGNGLQKAVEKSIRDERLKTDLITNVSHDIKTPLTSIINYVDLLKRENFEDPKIKGYLDILEMKAQRLKNLTEDVVEASKVSSGNITLEYMDVDLVEMLNQAIGEFSEKMEAKQLTVIASLPEEPAVLHVDGRRMWRVLENIFNNAAKYAMPGTRVYADLKKEGKSIRFSLKNVSEQPLNFSSDELTERFIRGDVSRSTEGSGLGLSIAKSLTEMQGGKFELYLDGDLFKVTIQFE